MANKIFKNIYLQGKKILHHLHPDSGTIDLWIEDQLVSHLWTSLYLWDQLVSDSGAN